MTAPALTADVTATDTLFYIDDTATIIDGAIYEIGSEQVRVTFVRDNRIGVSRGANHTTKATHAENATLTQASDIGWQTTQVATAGAAADVSGDYIIAPYAGTIVAAEVILSTAITGANTDSRSIEFRNRGLAGSGTTLVASKDFTLAVNGAADSPTAMTLSAVGGALTVAAGDLIEVLSIHVGGSGLALGPFTAAVKIAPAA